MSTVNRLSTSYFYLSCNSLLYLLLAIAITCGSTTRAEAGETAGEYILVQAGRLLDVRNGIALKNQMILIKGDRIVEVGSKDNVEIPKGTRVVDLSRATVLPGFIDLHTHMTFPHNLFGYRGLGVSVPREALYGATHARLTLEAGFTTVRNLGADGYSDVALREAINAGELPGPRMQVSGPSLGITGGHCDSNLLPSEFQHKEQGVADGPWEARAKVREVVKYGADVIKFCATGGVLSKGTEVGATQYTLEEMEAIVAEAHKLGRRVAAHAHGTEGIKLAIRAGVDSVEHASLLDDEGIALAKKTGVALSMNMYSSQYIIEEGEKNGVLPESMVKARFIHEKRQQNFRRAHEAGAFVVFSTDSGVYPHGENAKQFGLMVRNGMTPLEAIQAATIHAAKVMNWSEDIGSIEAGKFADLTAVEGDPLKDVTILQHVRFVMKGGKVFRNDL